jgi:hypothetical protein
MYALFENASGNAGNFEIVFPPGVQAKWKFKGAVTAFETSFAVEDAIGFTTTIAVSGKPELLIGDAAGVQQAVATGAAAKKEANS